MPIAAEGRVHAQVMLVTIWVVPTSVVTSIVIASKERVKEIPSERLGAHLIIAPVQVNRLLQTECVDSLQAFTLDFDLLGVWKVAKGHPTVIQSLTALLLFRT